MPGQRSKMKNGAAGSKRPKPSPTSGGCSSSGSSHAADAQTMMEVVVPVLLQHLAAPERLALFRCSKGLAQAILQHEEHIRLDLVATGSNPGVSDARASVAMLLACQAVSVELVMHDQMFVPPDELWPHITTLTLCGMSLPGSVMEGLMYARPAAHLKLRLERCALASGGSGGAGTSGAAASSQSKQGAGAGKGKAATKGAAGGRGTGAAGSKSSAGPGTSQPAAGSKQKSDSAAAGTSAARAPLSVYALECRACAPSDNAFVSSALTVINQGQLRELTLNDMLACPDQATLSGLTALERLSLQQVSLQDSHLQYFLSHKTLTDLTIGNAQWAQNHTAAKPPSLQRICIWYGCTAHRLASLPLAHINCSVRGELIVGHDVWREPPLAQQLAGLEANWAKLEFECFPNLSKPPPPPVPTRIRVSLAPPPRRPVPPPAPLGSTPPPSNLWHEAPARPSFTLTFPSPYLDSSQQVSADCQQQVVSLVCGRLAADTSLMLYGAEPGVLAALPTSITALGHVNPCECDPHDEDFMSVTDDLTALIAATPDHVNRLVVSGWALQSEEVKTIMAGLRPDLKLYLHDLILADIPTHDTRSMKAIKKAKGDKRDRLVRDVFLGLVNDWAKQSPHNLEVQVVGRFKVCDDLDE